MLPAVRPGCQPLADGGTKRAPASSVTQSPQMPQEPASRAHQIAPARPRIQLLGRHDCGYSTVKRDNY